jgi:hypothetical protein
VTIQRAESVAGGTPAIHAGRGGSIPASALFFHLAQDGDANALVLRDHYSHRIPANIQYIGSFHTSGGLFGTSGPCVAACYFSIPPTRWSEPVLELSRLVRPADVRVPLTKLIRLTVSRIKRDRTWHLLVSFADMTHGHNGYVYQAAGWNYDGQRDPQMDGVFVEGTFITGRNANHIWGTRSPERLGKLGIEAEPHYDAGKHLYWKALDREGESTAQRLGLRSKPYPKGSPVPEAMEGGPRC